jgi:hypothetical protein
MDIRTFDRAALLAAVEPPRFQDGETVYVGRVLSAMEWFRYEDRLQHLGDLGVEGGTALMREVIDVFFPPPSWWTRRCGAKRVADLVATLPYGLQLDAFLTFVNAQAAAQRWTVPGLRTRTPTTSGLSSPA